MAGDASCKMGRDPRDRSTLLFLAALQKLHLASIFPKVKQSFLLLGKWDPGIGNMSIKHKWIRWLWSESLNFVQNYLAHALEICSATGTIPQQGFTPWSAWSAPQAQLWSCNSVLSSLLLFETFHFAYELRRESSPWNVLCSLETNEQQDKRLHFHHITCQTAMK